ncbi:MAG: hypothetical protein ACOYN0_13825 [Phycisphaerales bacterium]
MRMATAPVRVEVPCDESEAGLVLSWSVSRLALAAAWPKLELPGSPEVSVVLTATLRAGGEAAEVRATVAGKPLLGEVTDAAAGGWMKDDESGLLHVRLREPTSDTPLLDATLRAGPDGPELLYARTTLLALLKLPGGRYEVSRASLTRSV